MSLLKLAFLLLCILAASAAAKAEGGPARASVKMEKFNPPAVIDNYNDLIGIVTVTNIPGSPGLVLHLPCIRSHISHNNSIGSGVVVAPGVVEGCNAQKIPWGKWAGELVKEDGTIFPVSNS